MTNKSKQNIKRITSIGFIRHLDGDYKLEFEDDKERQFVMPLKHCQYPIEELNPDAICSMAIVTVYYKDNQGMVEYEPVVKKIIGQTYDK